MVKIKRYAVQTKHIHKHHAPSGFVTSSKVVVDEINFFGTHEEAEAFIHEQTDSYEDTFWTIEVFYVVEPAIQST